MRQTVNRPWRVCQLAVLKLYKATARRSPGPPQVAETEPTVVLPQVTRPVVVQASRPTVARVSPQAAIPHLRCGQPHRRRQSLRPVNLKVLATNHPPVVELPQQPAAAEKPPVVEVARRLPGTFYSRAGWAAQLQPSPAQSFASSDSTAHDDPSTQQARVFQAIRSPDVMTDTESAQLSAYQTQTTDNTADQAATAATANPNAEEKLGQAPVDNSRVFLGWRKAGRRTPAARASGRSRRN